MRILLTLLTLVSLSHADSFGPTFALQQPLGKAPSYANVTNVQLGLGMPLLGPTLRTPYLMGNYLAFATLFTNASGPLTATLTIAGVTYTTGAGLFAVSSCIDSFALPRTFYHPTDAILTLSLGGDTRSYAFQFVDPVPEPSTWILMATGLGLLGRKRWTR